MYLQELIITMLSMSDSYQKYMNTQDKAMKLLIKVSPCQRHYPTAQTRWPPGQLSGMVGVGSFKGNTAMALGMTYLSKESNYKITGGFAYAGSDDILYQGGLAFAIGR